MKKILIIFLMLLLVGCKTSTIKDNNISKGDDIINPIKIVINDKEYNLNLENNETVTKLLEILPLDINMNELNGNEFYTYLDSKLPINSYQPKNIKKGDVMLYGDNCLVIFYKSFDTNYSYTKIGHIDDLPDLGSDNIKVEIK